jgi:hypothetical protein
LVIARAPLHQDETRVFASGSNAPFIARPAAVRAQETQSLFLHGWKSPFLTTVAARLVSIYRGFPEELRGSPDPLWLRRLL